VAWWLWILVGALALGASSLVAVFHPFATAEAYAFVFNAMLLGGILWAMAIGVLTRREALMGAVAYGRTEGDNNIAESAMR